MKLWKTVLSLVLLSAFVLAISGCNTVEGAGKDIESGGEGIQGAAQGAQEEMSD